MARLSWSLLLPAYLKHPACYQLFHLLKDKVAMLSLAGNIKVINRFGKGLLNKSNIPASSSLSSDKSVSEGIIKVNG